MYMLTAHLQFTNILIKDIAVGVESLGFDSRAGHIDTVSPTAHFRSAVSSELCGPGVKKRR